MTRLSRLTALLMAFLMLASLQTALAEGAVSPAYDALSKATTEKASGKATTPATVTEAEAPTSVPVTTEEPPAEETASPAPEASPAPMASVAPMATMATLKDDAMPIINAGAKAEAIVTAAEGTALFQQPSTESSILAQLQAAQVVSLTILGRTWSKVKSGELEGYVPTYTLSFSFGSPQPGIALITAPGGRLTLRPEMTTKSKSLGSIPSGRAVLLLAKGETFSLIRYGAKEGYILTRYLKEVFPDTALGQLTSVISIVASREANVRLRAEPSKKGEVYTMVNSGNSVVVISRADGWAMVEYEGFHGYMMEEYLGAIN
jgi:SH3-like domain-containing protein